MLKNNVEMQCMQKYSNNVLNVNHQKCMYTSKKRVTLSNDTPVTLACENMVSRTTAT